MFDIGNLYEFEERCTGLEVRAASVNAIAMIRWDRLPDPWPTFTVTEACDALAKDIDHPVLRVWFSDKEAIERNAIQIPYEDVSQVLAMMRGERPSHSAVFCPYFSCELAPRVNHWLPVRLREQGKKDVKEVKIIVDSFAW